MTTPLILHCGAHGVTRDDLYLAPKPEVLGPRHAPLDHADFLEELTAALDAYGFFIQEEAIGMTHDGNRLFGAMQVVHERLPAFEEGHFLVGFRGSHDQSFSRGICAGDRILVCDNLLFSGEFGFNTVHTLNLKDRLQVLLDGLMGDLMERFLSRYESMKNYRRTRISDETASHAIIEMARRDIVNWSELGKVTEEWYSPSHEEHAEDGNTVWRLQNAATEAMRIRNAGHPRMPAMMGRATNREFGKGPRLEALLDEVILAA